MIRMMKILHLSQNKKKIWTCRWMAWKITDSDIKVNRDDLIYRYKGNIADVNFNEFNNAFDIIDNIWDGKIDLANVKM